MPSQNDAVLVKMTPGSCFSRHHGNRNCYSKSGNGDITSRTYAVAITVIAGVTLQHKSEIQLAYLLICQNAAFAYHRPAKRHCYAVLEYKHAYASLARNGQSLRNPENNTPPASRAVAADVAAGCRDDRFTMTAHWCCQWDGAVPLAAVLRVSTKLISAANSGWPFRYNNFRQKHHAFRFAIARPATEVNTTRTVLPPSGPK